MFCPLLSHLPITLLEYILCWRSSKKLSSRKYFCNSTTPSYIGKPANEVTLQSWAAFNSLEALILKFCQPLCLFADRSVCFVMSYVRILGGTAAVSGGLYAYYRFRDSGQQVCKLRKLYICLYVSFLVSCSLAVFFCIEFYGSLNIVKHSVTLCLMCYNEHVLF